MQAAPNRTDVPNADETRRVLPFRRHRARQSPAAARSSGAESAIADDYARYEREPDEPSDDRHRMLMNFIAITIVTLLIGAGVWIADTIGDMDRDLNCVIQGRANCAPIEAAISTQR